eukprot:5110603-Prymnesium_polylepis.1
MLRANVRCVRSPLHTDPRLSVGLGRRGRASCPPSVDHAPGHPTRPVSASGGDLELVDACPTSRSGRSAAKYAHFCIRHSEPECERSRGRSRPRSRHPPRATEIHRGNLAPGELTAAPGSSCGSHFSRSTNPRGNVRLPP